MSDQALVELARQSLKRADGNRDEAARFLRKRIEEDQGLKLALIDDLINDEVWRLLRNLSRGAKAAAEAPAPANAVIVTGLRLKSHRAYMDMVLASSQKRLGDATAADLAGEVALLDDAIRMTTHTKRWYQAIADKLTGARRVCEMLTEGHLIALREEAKLQSRAS